MPARIIFILFLNCEFVYIQQKTSNYPRPCLSPLDPKIQASVLHSGAFPLFIWMWNFKSKLLYSIFKNVNDILAHPLEIFPYVTNLLSMCIYFIDFFSLCLRLSYSTSMTRHVASYPVKSTSVPTTTFLFIEDALHLPTPRPRISYKGYFILDCPTFDRFQKVCHYTMPNQLHQCAHYRRRGATTVDAIYHII